jgi:hypothetical protein
MSNQTIATIKKFFIPGVNQFKLNNKSFHLPLRKKESSPLHIKSGDQYERERKVAHERLEKVLK